MKTALHHRLTRKTVMLGAVLAACSVAGLVSLNAADDKKDAKKDTKKAPLSEEEGMKAWMEAATPGAAHKVLEGYIGTWNVHTKMWMQPGAPPMESDGTSVAKWILGNRYVEMTVESVMMGQPFEGRAITGYDNIKKTYQSIWVDNMGTSITLSSGSASDDGKTLTFKAKMDDAMTGEKDKDFKFIDRFVSKDEIVAEIHDLSRGKDSKMMEMTYKRKK